MSDTGNSQPASDNQPAPRSKATRAEAKAYADVYQAETQVLFAGARRRPRGPSAMAAAAPPDGEAAAPAGVPKAPPTPEDILEQWPADEERIGLALSGGGIRSAAFSLGVLQALDARGGFEKLNYLSTVSGGGYTGASLMAALARGGPDVKFPFSSKGEVETKGNFEGTDIADNALVTQLRDRCRYLVPDGWFSIPVSLGIILRGLAVNAVTVAAVLFLAAAVTLAFNPTVAHLERSSADGGGGGTLFEIAEALGHSFVVFKLMAVAFLVLLVAWGLLRSIKAAASPATPPRDPDSWPARTVAYALLALTAVFVLELQDPLLLWLRPFVIQGVTVSGWDGFTTILAGLAAGTGAAGLFAKTVVGAIQSTLGEANWPALVKRFSSAVLLAVLALALPMLIYLCYAAVVNLALIENGADQLPGWLRTWRDGAGLVFPFAITVLPVIGIVIWSRRVGPLGLMFSDDERGNPDFKRDVLEAIGFTIASWIVACLLAWGLYQLLAGRFDLAPFQNAYACLIVSIGLFAFVLVFADNANSLHHLYRDRLAYAFSIHGGEEGGPAGSGSEDGGRRRKKARTLPLRFSELRGVKPYLIVNTAVNIQSSDRNTRERNADIFTFTPCYVGSQATGYVGTELFQKVEPSLDLAAAAAISGAAVSANMGRNGMALLTPTLALLNVRLGYWVRNPNQLNRVGAAQQELASAQARLEAALGASPRVEATVAAARQAVSRAKKTFEAMHLKASRSRMVDQTYFYLATEMFGQLDETRPKVNLTDGGHIDNLGLMELLRRRCRIIIVSDAECDPGMVFSSLVDVQRTARIDHGIRIELDYEAVADAILARKARKERPFVPAPPHAHAAVGIIHYPAVRDEAAGVDLPKGKGLLLYVKATLTGDESAYVLDYEKRYPAFPQETTGDQFFSEEQFEAYRALGFHAMDEACKHAVGDVEGTGLLAHLRRDLDLGRTAGHVMPKSRPAAVRPA